MPGDMSIARPASATSPTDAASVVGSGPARRIEMPILSQVAGLTHLFTVRGSEAPVALAEAAGRALPIVSMKQVHGADVHVADRPASRPAGAPSSGSAPAPVGDALVVKEPGVAVAVWVADCVPVLLCDETTHSAAAVHAGWRGTVKGVVGAAIAVLRSRFGADPGRMRVAIGPCIGPCCFEVGDEVVEALLAAFPGAGGCVLPGDRRRIDLVEANRQQAEAAGVPAGRIQASGLCTVCRPDLLESYRRGRGTCGRMAGLIAWNTGREGAA
jgi:YfiH family protein